MVEFLVNSLEESWESMALVGDFVELLRIMLLSSNAIKGNGV